MLIWFQFWPHFGHPDNVELCLDKILKNMGLEYVDLYLSHWPCVFKPVSRQALENARAGPNLSDEDRGILSEGSEKPEIDWERCTASIGKHTDHESSFVPTWKAMQACVKTGKTRAVGLSNFSISEIQELLPHEGDVPISCNQVEVHPWLPQNELVDFARKNEILITCYSPFAGQKKDGATLLKDEKVIKLAEKNKMDVGQLLQSWAVQRDTSPLGKSATTSRIKSNLDVQRLSDEDMKALNDMALPDNQGRTVATNGAWGLPLYKD